MLYELRVLTRRRQRDRMTSSIIFQETLDEEMPVIRAENLRILKGRPAQLIGVLPRCEDLFPSRRQTQLVMFLIVTFPRRVAQFSANIRSW